MKDEQKFREDMTGSLLHIIEDGLDSEEDVELAKMIVDVIYLSYKRSKCDGDF